MPIKIKTTLTAVVFTLLATLGLAMTSSVLPIGSAGAQDIIKDNVCNGVNNLSINSTATTSGCSDTASGDKVNNLISTIINVFSVVVGIIAVIMIIVGGLKYITSGGDSAKVTSAKNSIVYAIIGLVIVVMAQVIVKFVLAKATTTPTTSQPAAPAKAAPTGPSVVQ